MTPLQKKCPSYQVFLCVLLSLFLCACTTTSKHGKEIDPAILPKISIGETTAAQIIELCGIPYSVQKIETMRPRSAPECTTTFYYHSWTTTNKRSIHDVNWFGVLLALGGVATTQPMAGVIAGDANAGVKSPAPLTYPPSNNNLSRSSTEWKSLKVDFDENGILIGVKPSQGIVPN